jgi:endonuclease G, mitochondrial
MQRFLLQTICLFYLSVQIVLAGPIEECKEFTAYGVPGRAGDLLCRKGYLLSHDPVRKTPVWVAEHLTREKAKRGIKRSDDFRPDDDLEPGKRAELSDYRGSGYDRGHMAPAGDMAWDDRPCPRAFIFPTWSRRLESA